MNWIRRFKVYVDGGLVGAIKNGATEVFEVTPGTHEVHLRIDWSESNRIAVDLEPGETARLQCGSACSAWRGLAASLAGRGAYIYLAMEEEP